MLPEDVVFQNKFIKNKIEENNQKIEQLLEPNSFILNVQVAEILSENKALQDKCYHVFVNGRCEYCGKEEVNNG